MVSRKEIDLSTWNRKKQFDWFSSFPNPCYGFTVKMDITEVINYSKETKTSFFINFLYILTLGLNASECMRTRYLDGHIYVYDVINPTYTVMTDNGAFENCGHKMSDDYKTFYERCHHEVEAAKHLKKVKDTYNDSNYYDDYYMTCIPNLDYIDMSHPLPENNMESSSVPRICWGKYKKENDRFYLSLNITVSHALVDGLPLGDAFNTIQKYLDNATYYYKK